jgi:hypothetical protein
MQVNSIIISQDYLAYKYICACLVQENKSQPKCRRFAAKYRNSDSIGYYANRDYNRDEYGGSERVLAYPMEIGCVGDNEWQRCGKEYRGYD